MGFKSKKLMVVALVISLLWIQVFSFPVVADSGQVVFEIGGSGVFNPVDITEADWSKYPLTHQIYSGNNSLGFHKIIKVKGYDLFALIGAGNLKTDKDYSVKFTCSDGFEFTKTISELKAGYVYTDFTDLKKMQVGPMIAKYSAVLGDFPKNSFNPPVSWVDRELKESDLDKDFPKLAFGQTSIDDMNLSQWGKQVIKVTVGDDRSPSTDQVASPYKHISYDGAPYNIDSITGATMTIEGPAVAGYRAISLRQLEGDIAGQKRITTFENVKGLTVQNTYEGLDVKYILDQYVKVKANAGNLIFKNKSRQTILTIPISEAAKYTIAYGINGVPYVYGDTDMGYRSKLYNDDGCFKLIYEQASANAKAFSNVAYIYVEEKDAKNIFEHSYAPYNQSKYADYELIVHGTSLPKEVRYTVKDIEKMTAIQTVNEYSLSNSEYFWYYNRYKGVTLWDLMLKAGLSPSIDDETTVRFITTDHYNFAPMTVREIKDSSRYGYYEKSALDRGDGTFDGNTVKPLKTNMPVLVAYGFNGYPYVIRPTDEGYNP